MSSVDEKKISIVMAYFNRKEQLQLTLRSIKDSKITPFEIIICDDGSDEDQILRYQDVESFKLNIKIITVLKEDKNWINPSVAYNKCIRETSGDIIVIQNPEVYHLYDCLNYITLHLNYNDWISFNIYGLPNFEANSLIKNNNNQDYIFDLINNSENKVGGTELLPGGGGGWLNNKNHFVAYHYLAAIYREDLINKLDGGFCELYKNGPCYDDDDLIKHLVYNKFNFKIAPFCKGEPMGIHLYHTKSHTIPNFKELHSANGLIFNERMKNINFKQVVSIYSSPENERPKPIITNYKNELYHLYHKVDRNPIISLVIISTNLKRRFSTLVNTINSFKQFYKINFDEIILSIDKLENFGETLSEQQIREHLCLNGILSKEQIHFKIGDGMVSNQCNGVGLAKGDIIIYSEDDIIIKKLPSRKNIIELTRNGVITYNKDLSYPGTNKDEDMELYKIGNQYDKKDFIICNNEYFYKKDKSRYSSEFNRYSSGRNLSALFPCAIMHKNIFTKVYNDISKLDFNFYIEASFSHVVNSSNYDSYIFCLNDNIPLDIPWLYRDNSNEIAVSGETIDRNSSRLSLLSNEHISKYNEISGIKPINNLLNYDLSVENMLNIEDIFSNMYLNYGSTFMVSNLQIKLANVLMKNEPVFISRVGGSDMNFIFSYLRGNGFCNTEEQILKEFNGYFDNSEDETTKKQNIVRFVDNYYSNLRNNEFNSFVEFLGMFIDKHLYNTHTPIRQKILDNLFNSSSMLFDYNSTFCNPKFIIEGMEIWAKGKKVLFISPFSESIEYQYQKKENLHLNLIIPDFELLTYTSPITYNTGNKVSFRDTNNWFEACDVMMNDIKDIDFDIAFLSCGCYANELGYKIKNQLKKKAIYLGGGLNLLFNIYGKRYTNPIWKPIADKYLNYDYQIKAIETTQYNDMKCARRFQNEGLNAYF